MSKFSQASVPFDQGAVPFDQGESKKEQRMERGSPEAPTMTQSKSHLSKKRESVFLLAKNKRQRRLFVLKSSQPTVVLFTVDSEVLGLIEGVVRGEPAQYEGDVFQSGVMDSFPTMGRVLELPAPAAQGTWRASIKDSNGESVRLSASLRATAKDLKGYRLSLRHSSVDGMGKLQREFNGSGMRLVHMNPNWNRSEQLLEQNESLHEDYSTGDLFIGCIAFFGFDGFSNSNHCRTDAARISSSTLAKCHQYFSRGAQKEIKSMDLYPIPSSASIAAGEPFEGVAIPGIFPCTETPFYRLFLVIDEDTNMLIGVDAVFESGGQRASPGLSSASQASFSEQNLMAHECKLTPLNPMRNRHGSSYPMSCTGCIRAGATTTSRSNLDCEKGADDQVEPASGISHMCSVEVTGVEVENPFVASSKKGELAMSSSSGVQCTRQVNSHDSHSNTSNAANLPDAASFVGAEKGESPQSKLSIGGNRAILAPATLNDMHKEFSAHQNSLKESANSASNRDTLVEFEIPFCKSPNYDENVDNALSANREGRVSQKHTNGTFSGYSVSGTSKEANRHEEPLSTRGTPPQFGLSARKLSIDPNSVKLASVKGGRCGFATRQEGQEDFAFSSNRTQAKVVIENSLLSPSRYVDESKTNSRALRAVKVNSFGRLSNEAWSGVTTNKFSSLQTKLLKDENCIILSPFSVKGTHTGLTSRQGNSADVEIEMPFLSWFKNSELVEDTTTTSHLQRKGSLSICTLNATTPPDVPAKETERSSSLHMTSSKDANCLKLTPVKFNEKRSGSSTRSEGTGSHVYSTKRAQAGARTHHDYYGFPSSSFLSVFMDRRGKMDNSSPFIQASTIKYRNFPVSQGDQRESVEASSRGNLKTHLDSDFAVSLKPDIHGLQNVETSPTSNLKPHMDSNFVVSLKSDIGGLQNVEASPARNLKTHMDSEFAVSLQSDIHGLQNVEASPKSNLTPHMDSDLAVSLQSDIQGSQNEPLLQETLSNEANCHEEFAIHDSLFDALPCDGDDSEDHPRYRMNGGWQLVVSLTFQALLILYLWNHLTKTHINNE